MLSTRLNILIVNKKNQSVFFMGHTCADPDHFVRGGPLLIFSSGAKMEMSM